MKISSTLPQTNSVPTANAFEYKAKPWKDAYQVTFMDTTSNKKVSINIDEKLTNSLYSKFKDDMDFKDKDLKVTGNLKSYLETMWQNLHHERNFVDSDNDGYLGVEERYVSKSRVNFTSLANSNSEAEVQWTSAASDYKFSKQNEKDYKDFLTKETSKHKELFTLNSAFLGYLKQDKNFDTKTTNAEVIDTIKEDLGEEVTEMMLAQNSSKLDTEGLLLKAILAWIEKKKEEIENGLVPTQTMKVAQDVVKVYEGLSKDDMVKFEENPLGYLMQKSEETLETKPKG